MNWFKKLFHKHKWEILTRGTFKRQLFLFGKPSQNIEDWIIIHRKCEVCGKEEAYMEDINSNKEPISIEYLKMKLREKENETDS